MNSTVDLEEPDLYSGGIAIDRGRKQKRLQRLAVE
jgi:hypothetical protein